MKKFLRFVRESFVAVVLGVAFAYFIVLPVGAAIAMPSEIRLTNEELENRQYVSPNQFVTSRYDEAAMVDDEAQAWVDLKLFGIIPIKRVKVDVLPFDSLLAGGVAVGFAAKTDGVIVLQDGSGYKRGDVITSMDGVKITSAGDLEKYLGGKNLGVWGKDETSGVGMLTYINPDNNNFAALGHKIVDHETGTDVCVRAGEVYTCNVLGIEKSSGRKVGEFKSTLKKGSNGIQGSVLSSNERGVFGCLNEDSKLLSICNGKLYPVASRYSVKPGKAQVLMSLDGESVREYNIEILKTKWQTQSADKGLVIRVTDKELLAKTGGIIHGMSGSPIIQDGKLVGAVTHVMTGDATKGYGLYIDFMTP